MAQYTRHIHIDPVGGAAGDMFVAAMLDLLPALHSVCLNDLDVSGVLEHVSVELESGDSQGLSVKRFQVKNVGENPRATGHYSNLRSMLDASLLELGVKRRALDIFDLLAAAESEVHGVAIADVHFHEVADWDSVADVVAAASLIERSQVQSWSCACLPVGSGLVDTEHGKLPVPAPATQVLLKGLMTFDDGESGERVTPTGAALIKYLSSMNNNSASFQMRPLGVGVATGCGAGQRALQHRPNMLRCSLLDLPENSSGDNPLQASHVNYKHSLNTDLFIHTIDNVAQLQFAIDDMSSEELAVALQHIRQADGVIDVSHAMSFGKKGRVVFDVTVLCKPVDEQLVARLCFLETSTLGMRVQIISRRVLNREQSVIEDDTGSAGVKSVQRPSTENGKDQQTYKIENDDVRRVSGLKARRDRTRNLENIYVERTGSDNAQSGIKNDEGGV